MAFQDDRPVNQEVLYDADGNAVSVVLDGTVYRLATDTKLATSDEVIGRIKITNGSSNANINTDGCFELGVRDDEVLNVLHLVLSELRLLTRILTYAAEAEFEGEDS